MSATLHKNCLSEDCFDAYGFRSSMRPSWRAFNVRGLRNINYHLEPDFSFNYPRRHLAIVLTQKNTRQTHAIPLGIGQFGYMTFCDIPLIVFIVRSQIHHQPRTFAIDQRLGLLSNDPYRANSDYHTDNTDTDQCIIGEILRAKQTREVAWRLCGMCLFLPLGCLLVYYSLNLTYCFYRILAFSGGVLFVCVAMGLGFLPIYHQNCEDGNKNHHGVKIVPQKHLTNNTYWGTVIDMANVLNTDKQIAVIGALAEGSSIRSIERITGVHRDTVMRLGVKVGQGCATMMNTAMRDLPCNRLEMDEIWGFVGKKDRNVREGEDGVGSVWTFCAIDAETKLVPAFKVGNRDAATAKAFVQDVANRMAYRVQISTDGLTAYVPAMEAAFGGNVDYAQIIKTYGHEEVSNNRRYSAPEFVSSEKKIVVGNPDQRLISTSYIERLNATTRLHMRRLTRLTLAFSKKRENFEAAVALHFAYYNFVKRHGTLRCTPAMAAGVTGTFWGVGDLLEAVA